MMLLAIIAAALWGAATPVNGVVYNGWAAAAAGMNSTFGQNWETDVCTSTNTSWLNMEIDPRGDIITDNFLQIISNASCTPTQWVISGSAFRMFYGKTNFNGDISGWDTSQVTYMNAMFSSATKFNSDISGWDTSQVSNMEQMFFNANDFNGNLSGWDTSQVIDMDNMFKAASNFNVNISGWDTSQVTYMNAMFEHASSFNGDLSRWDTSKVEEMSHMFFKASSFNASSVCGWNVTSVTYSDYNFQSTADNCSAYNTLLAWNSSNSIFDNQIESFRSACPASENYNGQCDSYASDAVLSPPPAGVYYGWAAAAAGMEALFNSNWETDVCTSTYTSWLNMEIDPQGETITNNFLQIISNASCTPTQWVISGDAYRMFFYESSFNGNISGWNTSKVIDMENMFYEASNFSGNISGWDTSKVTNMRGMFFQANSFNGDLSEWDTSQVSSMASMFMGATAFNGNISGWDTSNVEKMNSMFERASNFNGDLSEWDTSKVTDMKYMFYQASSFNASGVCGWNVTSVTYSDYNFQSTADNCEAYNTLLAWNSTAPVFNSELESSACQSKEQYTGVCAREPAADLTFGPTPTPVAPSTPQPPTSSPDNSADADADTLTAVFWCVCGVAFVAVGATFLF